LLYSRNSIWNNPPIIVVVEARVSGLREVILEWRGATSPALSCAGCRTFG